MSAKRLWYLSGGMTKFGKEGFDESNNWRKRFQEKIAYLSNGEIVAFNPNAHFSCVTDPSEFTDREAMNIDIFKLRKSELMIYWNNDPFSRGSMIEFGIAWERRIPIITVNFEDKEIHPWVAAMSEKIITKDMDEEELFWYLEDHYMRLD